ncbi:hypothetical protein [Qipengyuania sp.]|uniref:hypothetical protein n=1 Tax=Qipengyuania sp. TaxID=2004515 RepID=UPI003518073F
MAGASKPSKFFGEADFVYGGELYRLTLDNMALLEAEGVLGESMMDFLPQLQGAITSGGNPQIRHLAAIMYGGLKNNHPKIEQRDVVDMAMSKDPALLKAMVEAMEAIEVPEDDTGEPGNGEPAGNRQQRRAARAGAGTRSTGSGRKQASSRKPSGGKPREARS